MPRRNRRSMIKTLILWSCTLTGGGATGIGLFLMAQVRVIQYVREEVDRIGFFTRLFGKATFLWRSNDEKLALALNDVPDVYLDHAYAVGFWLVAIGLPFFSILLPGYLRWRWRRR